MANAFDHRSTKQEPMGSQACSKAAFPLPSVESLVIVAALVLPIIVYCWRSACDVHNDPESDQQPAAVAAALPISKKPAARITQPASPAKAETVPVLPSQQPPASADCETSQDPPFAAQEPLAGRTDAALQEVVGSNAGEAAPDPNSTPTAIAPSALPASAVGTTNDPAEAKAPAATSTAPEAVAQFLPLKTAAPASIPARSEQVSGSGDPEADRMLAEAWVVIERGDFEAGRSRLQDARKKGQNDLRAVFSLALLDGLVSRDWAAAEKKFDECLRHANKNTALLNNLAVAEVHNNRVQDAVKHWKAIVEQRTAAPEVVQNLGRVRQLIKDGEIPRTAALVKTLDAIYAEAAVATSAKYHPQLGFRLMPLQVTDGRIVGWADRRMEDKSPLASAAKAATKNLRHVSSQGAPTAPPPGVLSPLGRGSATQASGYPNPQPPASPEQRGAVGRIPGNPGESAVRTPRRTRGGFAPPN